MTEQPPQHPSHEACCTELAEQLLLFRDGDLGPHETEHLRLHLHRCPMCLDLLSSYDEVIDVLQRLEPSPPPAGFAERLKKRLAEGI